MERVPGVTLDSSLSPVPHFDNGKQAEFVRFFLLLPEPASEVDILSKIMPQQIRNIRTAFRILKSGDISQQDWQPGQIICCMQRAPECAESNNKDSTIESDKGACPVAVLIDFAYASQTEVGTHLESPDFELITDILHQAHLGFRMDVVAEAWEPEVAELDWGSRPV